MALADLCSEEKEEHHAAGKKPDRKLEGSKALEESLLWLFRSALCRGLSGRVFGLRGLFFSFRSVSVISGNRSHRLACDHAERLRFRSDGTARIRDAFEYIFSKGVVLRDIFLSKRNRLIVICGVTDEENVDPVHFPRIGNQCILVESDSIIAPDLTGNLE